MTLKPGGPDITPEQVVASGQAEFGIDWLPALLAARDQGGDLVNIAQVFGKSGMTELTWKDSGITDVAAMKGKKVGVWCCGNENELYAALVKNGIDPKSKDDVTIVNQPFDMNLFLNKDVDAAAAMTYNELAQVLETKNPDTDELYTLDDLNVISMEDAGTAMLEDGIFTQGDWIAGRGEPGHRRALPEGELQGLGVLPRQPGRVPPDRARQWPDPRRGAPALAAERDQRADLAGARAGIGVMDSAAFQRTADIAKQFAVIKAAASSDSYRTDLAEAAVEQLKSDDVDVTGDDWQKETVEVTAGGD